MNTPATNTATPAWANSMPTISAVKRLPVLRIRCQTKRPVPATIHAAPAMPKAVLAVPCGQAKKVITPNATASAAHGASQRRGCVMSSRCQRISGPNGSSSTSGAISRMNSRPK